MDLKRFEAEKTEGDTCKEVPFVRRAGTVLGVGAAAVFAVGVVGIYAFVGKNSIPRNDDSAPSTAGVTSSVTTDSAENQTDNTVSQVAVTWRKAGIDEYDLVVETVKATEKTTTTAPKTTTTEAETTSASVTTTAEQTATQTAQTTAEAAQTEAQTQAAQTEVAQTVEVNSCAVVTMYADEKLNMRKGPSLDDDVIAVLEADEEFTVTGYTDDWYRIKYNGQTGYCMKRYVTDEKPVQEEETDEAETSTSTSGSVISYTDSEFEMLCYVLQGEVGDCSESSKIAVANVIINRVKSSSFPDTITGVLTQANQFTAVYGYYNRSTTPTQNTIDCAKRALSGEDNTNGAIYYYAPQYCGGSTAAWFETLTFCMEIDGQRYFK